MGTIYQEVTPEVVPDCGLGILSLGKGSAVPPPPFCNASLSSPRFYPMNFEDQTRKEVRGSAAPR